MQAAEGEAGRASSCTPERPAAEAAARQLFLGARRTDGGHDAGRTGTGGGSCRRRHNGGCGGGSAGGARRAVHERLGRRRGVWPHVRRLDGSRGCSERPRHTRHGRGRRRAVRCGRRRAAPHGPGKRRVVARLLCGHRGSHGGRRGRRRGRPGHGLWGVLRPVDGGAGARRIVCGCGCSCSGARRRRGDGRGRRAGRRVRGGGRRRAAQQRGKAGPARFRRRRGAAGPDRSRPRRVAGRPALLARRIGRRGVQEGGRNGARRARVRRDPKCGHVARQDEVPGGGRGVRDDQRRAAQPGSDRQGCVGILHRSGIAGRILHGRMGRRGRHAAGRRPVPAPALHRL